MRLPSLPRKKDAPAKAAASPPAKGRFALNLKRGKDAPAEAPAKPAAKPAAPSPGPAAEPAAAAHVPAPSAPTAAPAAPGKPDPQVEAQLKKFGDQLAKVTSGLEAQRTESKEVSAKLGSIEEQLRSFITLSEALSNQFNPMAAAFKDAPPPASPAPAEAPPAPAAAPAPPAPAPPPAALPAAAPSPAALPEPAPPAPALAAALPPPMPLAEDVAPPPAVDAMGLVLPFPPPPPVPQLPAAPAQAHGPLLDDLPAEPEAALAALAWLDQLAQATGSDGVRRLLQYYESIGWIGARAHVRLLTLAAGLPPRAPPEHLPSALDVHAASYQNLERLRAPRSEALLRVPSIPGSVLVNPGDPHGR